MIVEDETELREVLTEAINDEGYATLGAALGDEAVALLTIPNLKLVITDINLPGAHDGIDVAIAARAAHPGIPLMFISGQHWQLDDAKKKLAGPAAFLPKPFSLSTLIEDVQRLMASAQPRLLHR
ncbi:MAG: response regulator [Acetobacteraceae bacterium]|nr:response regulator [Pseudomonadota bacterium]